MDFSFVKQTFVPPKFENIMVFKYIYIFIIFKYQILNNCVMKKKRGEYALPIIGILYIIFILLLILTITIV